MVAMSPLATTNLPEPGGVNPLRELRSGSSVGLVYLSAAPRRALKQISSASATIVAGKNQKSRIVLQRVTASLRGRPGLIAKGNVILFDD